MLEAGEQHADDMKRHQRQCCVGQDLVHVLDPNWAG